MDVRPPARADAVQISGKLQQRAARKVGAAHRRLDAETRPDPRLLRQRRLSVRGQQRPDAEAHPYRRRLPNSLSRKRNKLMKSMYSASAPITATFSCIGPVTVAIPFSFWLSQAVRPRKTKTPMREMPNDNPFECTKMLRMLKRTMPIRPMKKNEPHDVRSRLVTRP